MAFVPNAFTLANEFADDDLLIPVELLEFLDDTELAAYLDALQICERLEGAWALQPRQQAAEDACNQLMAEGQPFELLYGGAGAGGKSEWLLWHLHHLALRFPGFSGILLRRTYKELERTAILRSLSRFDKERARYNATLKRWSFDNGSRIEFGFCDTDRDVYQYDSDEYDVVAWDELTQFPTDGPYRYLWSRLRTSVLQATRGFVPHMVGATNPHRTGVAWVKPRWVDIGPPGEVYDVDTEVDEGNVQRIRRVFIPAKMTDNRYVNQEAYRAGLSQLDPAIRLAIEEGSWDVIAGQYFDEWRRDLHVVKPFKIPGHWRRFSGYDFGIAKPSAHEWVALDGDGVLWVYREMYGAGMVPSVQAAKIRGAENEKVDYRVADPSIWTRTGAGPPIATQFADAGVIFRKANNARIDGWTRLREYLRCTIPDEDPVTGEIRFLPRIRFFETCHDLVRTLPLLVHDDKNPEDCDTEGEDHAPDALRYAVMSRPMPPRAPSSHPADTREDRHARSVREIVRARNGNVVDHPILGRMTR